MFELYPSFLSGHIEMGDDEVVALLGKSGSGKTTVIKEAMGFGGKAKLGIDGSFSMPPVSREVLAAVMQDPNVQVLGGSCDDELAILSMDHQIDRAMAKAIMGDYCRTDFFRLSDGYKKRMAIATVLCSLPRYVMLDEPLANLDRAATADVLSLVRGGMMVAEHRVKEIRDKVQRAYLIRAGLLVELASDSLYDDEFLRKNGLRGFSVEAHKGNPGEVILDVDVGFRLTVRAGEVLCLYGSNGVGKTTCIKRLVGKAYAVFQNPDLQFFKKSVEEEVGSVHALSLFDLQNKAKASPFALSYGEKMRVLVAAAYASGRKVIALDEPTVGMDGDGFLSFLKVLEIMREESRGIVIATHDDDLLRVCDRVVSLDELFGRRA
ncbi:ATP-binding cassette domain-containing protein [Tardisphaera miroshnichenkoae]